MDIFCHSGPAYAGFHSGPKPGECRGNPEKQHYKMVISYWIE
jgi:hypothetical protein